MSSEQKEIQLIEPITYVATEWYSFGPKNEDF